MQSHVFARIGAVFTARRHRFGSLLVCLLLCFLALPASAQVSVTCPTLSATVANGGSVVIDVSICDDPDNFGLGATVTPPSHGTIIVRTTAPQTVTYSHNGDSATSDTFVIRDGQSPEGNITFNITITPPASAIVVSPAILPTLTAGEPFSQALSSSGGTAPYTYNLDSGTLPPGLSLTPAGVLSGTPTQRGGYSFSILSTDSLGDSAVKSYTGTVQNPTLSISPASGTAIQGVPFSLALSTTGGVPAHSYALETGSFPAGIAISGAGVISGTTNATVGSYPVTLRVTDASTGPGSYFELESFTLTVSPPPSVSISVSPASVNEDDATGLVYTLTRSLNLSSATVVNITTSGTATAGIDYTGNVATATILAGATTATITIEPVADGAVEADETVILTVATGAGYTVGTPSSATGTILDDDVPVTVSPGSLPDGAVAAAYSQTVGASGGIGPYAFAVSAGALPAGLTLSSGGALSGTPTASGTFNFTITATDSNATPGPNTGSQAYAVTIAAPTIALPATSLPDGALATAYSASITAASGGTAPYAYAVTSGALPDGLALDTATGAITGTPNAAGTFNFGITATDSTTGDGPYAAVQSYSIIVIEAPPVAGAVSVTVPYNAAATAVTLDLTGGAAASVAVATAPLHGTAVATGTTITYQPVAGYAGPDSFTYTATNGGGTSAPATVTVTVSDPVITITAGAPLTASVGVAYSQTFTFNGGATPWSGFQVTNLPAGLSITGTTASTVTISGTPTEVGSFALNVSATDSSTGNGPYTVGEVFNLNVAGPTLALTPAAGTLSAPYATPFSQAFTASGGSGSYSYALTGALPAGVVFSGDTLSGTPTVPGSYPITVTATDTGLTGTGAPFSIAQNYTLEVSAPNIVVDPATLPDPVAGATYGQTLTASGGAAPYGFALTTGSLPAGLSLGSGGALSGTPTEVGTFPITVTATDSLGQSGSRSYTLTIVAPTQTLAPAAGTLNAPYATPFSQAFTASGGSGSFSYALTGALPAGVVFSGDTLSGTPTVPGSYPITITATDTGLTGTGAPFSIAQNYTLEVSAPNIVVDPATLPDTTAGLAYAQQLTATGGVAPYAFATTAGALPTGLTLAADGALSGTASASGAFAFTVTATDAHGSTASRAYTVTVAVPTLALTPAALPPGVSGTAYNQALTVSGGLAPYVVTQSGTLPAGLAFDAATRTFSGTPTQSGTFNVSVTVTDSTGGSAATLTQQYTLDIAAPSLALTPATLADGIAGVAYRQHFTATGGVAPYTYAIGSGSLPTGLALDAATGELTGTPVEAGTFSFSVSATDSTAGSPGVATVAYVLNLSVPTITIDPAVLPDGVYAIAYRQALSATGGTAPYTFAVTAGALPDGVALAGDGVLDGTPGAAGNYTFTITATDALGFSGARAYGLAIIARPDPTQDPEVRGLLDAQVQSTRRFATAQIGNFQQRMESLHGGGDRARGTNRLTFAGDAARCEPQVGRIPGQPCAWAWQDDQAATATAAAPAQNLSNDWAIWVGGAIRSGNHDGRGGAEATDFETDGLSVGADLRLNDAFVLGAGLGWGRDDSEIGSRGSRSEGEAHSVALYGSYHPNGIWFVDGLLGYQSLSYDLRRRVTVNDALVSGRRDGSQWFGSLSVGADIRRSEQFQLTPYARFEVARASLDGYTETGDPLYALRHEAMDVDTSTANLGLRGDYRHETRWGVIAPSFRLEYQYDLEGTGTATMRYADLLSGPFYRTELGELDRSRFMIGLGARFALPTGLSTRIEYRSVLGDDQDHGVMLNLEKSF